MTLYATSIPKTRIPNNFFSSTWYTLTRCPVASPQPTRRPPIVPQLQILHSHTSLPPTPPPRRSQIHRKPQNRRKRNREEGEDENGGKEGDDGLDEEKVGEGRVRVVVAELWDVSFYAMRLRCRTILPGVARQNEMGRDLARDRRGLEGAGRQGGRWQEIAGNRRWRE